MEPTPAASVPPSGPTSSTDAEAPTQPDASNQLQQGQDNAAVAQIVTMPTQESHKFLSLDRCQQTFILAARLIPLSWFYRGKARDMRHVLKIVMGQVNNAPPGQQRIAQSVMPKLLNGRNPPEHRDFKAFWLHAATMLTPTQINHLKNNDLTHLANWTDESVGADIAAEWQQMITADADAIHVLTQYQLAWRNRLIATRVVGIATENGRPTMQLDWELPNWQAADWTETLHRESHDWHQAIELAQIEGRLNQHLPPRPTRQRNPRHPTTKHGQKSTKTNTNKRRRAQTFSSSDDDDSDEDEVTKLEILQALTRFKHKTDKKIRRLSNKVAKLKRKDKNDEARTLLDELFSSDD